MSGEAVETTAKVVNLAGIHARPAAALVKLAARFSCEIEVGKDGLMVNAKSIMGVMMLAAEHGSDLHIRCMGADASDACEALAALVASGFEEEM
jgi:phosphocarrier protein HPr